MNDQIIEKRASSPLGTTLLSISAVAMLAAVVLLGVHLKKLSVEGAEGPTTSASVFYKGKSSMKQAKKLLAEHSEMAESDVESDDMEPDDSEEG